MQHSNACGPLDVGPDAEAAFGGLSGRLTVDLLSDARGVAVKLDGELDLATVPELDRHLARIEVTEVSRVLIDLSGVTFMDSTGLTAFIAARNRLKGDDSIVLTRPRPNVLRVFEITGLDNWIVEWDDRWSTR